MARVDIGGQAVMEGVMMKGKKYYCVAVRKEDQTIVTDTQDANSLLERYKILRLPLIRGVVVFVESMILGLKTLMYSAELYGEVDEEEEIGKFEQWLMDRLGEKAEKILMGFVMFLSFVFAMGIFMVLPMFLSRIFKTIIPSGFVQNLLEGAIRIAIFLIYMKLVSQMKDIARTFEYHGAEHKTINCLEEGKELTVENVKVCTRLHKSCGTSFLFVVMIVSILIFSLFRTDVLWIKTVLRIVLIPVISGVSYEFIRWARLSPDNPIANFLSKPGMWLQKEFTTREPDDQQIEVAIAAVNGVLEKE